LFSWEQGTAHRSLTSDVLERQEAKTGFQNVNVRGGEMMKTHALYREQDDEQSQVHAEILTM
jgi:hypothetical protein